MPKLQQRKIRGSDRYYEYYFISIPRDYIKKLQWKPGDILALKIEENQIKIFRLMSKPDTI